MYSYIFIGILFTHYVKCFEMPQTWVNPSDFRNSRRTDNSAPSVENSPSVSSCVPCLSKTNIEKLECVCPENASNSACSSYFIRVLNKLLIKSNLKNFRLPKESIRIVPLTLYFNAKNLEILQHFASGNDLDTYSWSDFDEAFNSIFMIQEIKSDDDKETTKTSNEIIEERDHALFFFITIVSSLLIIGLWLFLKSGSLFKSFGGIYMVAFSIALVWNLNRAYKIEKGRISVDAQLLKKEMTNRSGWKNYVPGAFLRIFSTEDELILPAECDPMTNVDFGTILIETFFSFLNVLPILGTKIGQMTHNFYAEQNFVIRFVVSTLSFLTYPFIFGMIVLLIIAMYKGFFLKIPMLFTIGIGQSQNSTNMETHRLQNNQENAIENDSGQRRKHRAIINRQDDECTVKKFHPITYASQSQSSHSETSTSNGQSRSQKYPILRLSRKGPWQGSIIRYGFIKKNVAIK